VLPRRGASLLFFCVTQSPLKFTFSPFGGTPDEPPPLARAGGGMGADIKQMATYVLISRNIDSPKPASGQLLAGLSCRSVAEVLKAI
jgi:hypothetical protein